MGEAAMTIEEHDAPLNSFGESEAEVSEQAAREVASERARVQAPKVSARIETVRGIKELATISSLEDLRASPNGGSRAVPEWWGMTSPIARCEPAWVVWKRPKKARRVRRRRRLESQQSELRRAPVQTTLDL